MSNADANKNKQVLVLARNEPVEAMRVAAGLTIIGHTVNLIFMSRVLTEDEANHEHGELLELCDIEPMTTIVEMKDYFTLLNRASLALELSKADMVVNL